MKFNCSSELLKKETVLTVPAPELELLELLHQQCSSRICTNMAVGIDLSVADPAAVTVSTIATIAVIVRRVATMALFPVCTCPEWCSVVKVLSLVRLLFQFNGCIKKPTSRTVV